MSCPSPAKYLAENDPQGALCVHIPDLPASSDEDLTRMWQGAEPGTAAEAIFDEIYRRYQSRVAIWCSRLIGDAGRGMDLAQEVFMKAYRYRHTFRGDSRLSTWLYAIARNQCLNAIRKLEVDPLARTDEFPPDLSDRSGKVHAEVENAEAFRHLWSVFEKTLTDMEKRVMALHYAHNLTLESITRSCGLENASGAKAYIVSAKRKLKRHLHARRSTAADTRAA